MSDFHVEIGQTTEFSKTVGESDIYLFAGITGDLSSNHVNQAVMEKTAYGKRIAHGVLIVGFMSTASTQISALTDPDAGETPVSAGYDTIRFIAPVFIGDTITVRYVVTDIDLQRRRSISKVEVYNQHDQLVAVANHILQWVPNA